ncbi:MAG: YfhO family protein [Acidobacteriota bacterium]
MPFRKRSGWLRPERRSGKRWCPALTARVRRRTDTYYPGWRAQIDGAGVPISRTDGTFRGVVVPPGRHVVEMRFVSRSFEAGMALSVLFWLLCAAAAVELIFFGRRSTAAGDNP